MIPLSQGFYCEQPQILLAGKKYIFGPQGSLLAQSLQLTRLPRLTSEDCAAPCWRYPGPFTPCTALVGGAGAGEGICGQQKKGATGPPRSSLLPLFFTSKDLSSHLWNTPHPRTAPEIQPGVGCRCPQLKGMHRLKEQVLKYWPQALRVPSPLLWPYIWDYHRFIKLWI